MDQYQSLFEYINRLIPIDRDEFEKLSPNFHFQKAKRKEFILREGEVCQAIYFILKGSFRMYQINESGQEMIRYFALEDKFGTNLTSLIEGSPSMEFIQAIEETEFLKIHKTDFFRLVETSPHFNKVYRNILENAYITSQKRIYKLQGMSALDKLKWLNQHYPGILTRIPSRMIASYLGITPFTLSRLKSELN
ncbi:CRP-like cAMP-binding protein [Algoriphagus boseongensis]|uniref:CRP-like cAMP-binding protein n=1 Tax=Algoriphagus boseongensis TaxID=1442587 RepID=A0A4R6TBN5_9BACT|nr:Crp/Fnr family transcriptional regulator [Algoriphagus boseongensis]TDQ18874.1 CRP-like cAMP-binding protein [Algoriphagus boseongensis]